MGAQEMRLLAATGAEVPFSFPFGSPVSAVSRTSGESFGKRDVETMLRMVLDPIQRGRLGIVFAGISGIPRKPARLDRVMQGPTRREGPGNAAAGEARSSRLATTPHTFARGRGSRGGLECAASGAGQVNVAQVAREGSGSTRR